MNSLIRRQRQKVIDLDDDYPTFPKDGADEDGVSRGGLLVWVETPLNPTGEVRNLAHYAKRVSTIEYLSSSALAERK